MRHITDGELHAYLDGALEHLAEGRGTEVRRHLEECPACRERMQDEEGIRERAQELLELAAPLEMPLPSFEALRARGEASAALETEEKGSGRYRGPLRGLPLAWAATVVLALGVGWMGGEVWRTAPPRDSGVPDPLSPALHRASSPAPAAEDEARAPVRDALEGEAGATDPPSSGALQESARVDLGVVEAGAGGSVGATPPPPAAAVSEVDAFRRAAESAGAREKAAVQDLAVPEARTQGMTSRPEALGLSPSAPAPGGVAASEAMLRNRAVAEDNSLLVPGFEVVTVEWEEWLPGERALHIRQLLPMGDTLELRFLGLLMGSDPDLADPPVAGRAAEAEGIDRPLSPKVMEASLPPGWNQVVMRWGRGWLVARAPLPAESLRGILRSIH